MLCEEPSMGNEADNIFTWVIKNFSSLQSKRAFSDIFVVGRCKWRLLAFPKGDRDNRFLSLYLVVAGLKTLPCGWRRHAKLTLKVVNQLSEQLSQVKATQAWWFDQKTPALGFPEMFSLTKLHAKDGGFLVNGEVKVVVEIDILEVVGKLDVSEESEAATQPLKKMKREYVNAVSTDSVNKTPPVKERIDVSGFQSLPSQLQAQFLSRVLEKHPDIALAFKAKNQHLRTGCMFVLLGLVETLCKSLEMLSNDNLVEADNSLTYLQKSGFKVDWLEKKLEEVKEKKKEERIGETRVQELEEELKEFKQKCSDIEEHLKDLKQKCSDTRVLLEKEKTKVLVARAYALTLDDLV